MLVMVYGEGEVLVGWLVVKKFWRIKYFGKVMVYDLECKWYKVFEFIILLVKSGLYIFVGVV